MKLLSVVHSDTCQLELLEKQGWFVDEPSLCDGFPRIPLLSYIYTAQLRFSS